MKGRKLLAMALCLTLCLGLSVSALAVDEKSTHEDFRDLMFIDPTTKDYRWKWAWPTVDDAIRRGLFIGYTPYKDANGNTVTDFGPGDPVTEAVGLTLCARMIVDAEQRGVILNDRMEQMNELIPDDSQWFRKEAATCLELGVISAEDLELLRDADRLGKPMSKADFAVYLVRAMGLEDFAKSLNAQDLSFFKDEAKIGREYRPYVKLLYNYGVLTGDENRNFNPNQSMNRAVCATMLSRAIESILEERKVAVELPRYTDYPFASGVIEDVSVDAEGVRVLTLRDLNGTETYSLPSSAQIYQNNMPAKATDLKNGSFAKLGFNNNGEVIMVRLTPAGFLSSLEGECDKANSESVVVDGVSYTIDRFTQVSAGGKVGDRSIIDVDAGYTDAKLTANSRKRVLSLTLTGGTRKVDGILTDVTTTTQGTIQRTTATVNSLSGLPTTYDITDQVTVTLKGQKLDGLKETFEGKHVVLRVADGDFSDLKSVDVDLDNQYIQGVLQKVDVKQTPNKVEITRLGATRRTPYEVDEDCTASYEGEASKLQSLPTGVFVTAKLEGATVTDLSAWTGLESVEGTLTDITYPDPVTLTVTGKDGAKSSFSIALEELKNVTILVNGEDGDITDLATGDQVVVTLRYHQLSQIDVTPRAADVTGTLDAITSYADRSAKLVVRLSDGTTREYTAAASVTVTRDNTAAKLEDIPAGVQVSLVTDGTKAVSIQFSGSAVSQSSVEGKIISLDMQERVAMVMPAGDSAVPVKIHMDTGVSYLDVSGVQHLTRITQLSVGDTIEVYGAYGTDGVFEAKSVIRK